MGVAEPLYSDRRLAGVYQGGNEMPVDALASWVGFIGSFSPRRERLAVLEVGAGTGMFTAGMARWLRPARVLGVDSSTAMLREAVRENPHPRVWYVAGSADGLPLRSGRFDLVLLSRVVHHLPDRVACARELARVLRAGGRVVVRTTVRERLDALVYDYFPGLLDSDRRRFPGLEELCGNFAAAGFALHAVESYAQPVTPSLWAYRDRLATRPMSKFAFLSDVEFADGLERLTRDAEVEQPPRPVSERYDVLVFELASVSLREFNGTRASSRPPGPGSSDDSTITTTPAVSRAACSTASRSAMPHEAHLTG